jgi:hypothetical protein
MGEVTAGSVCDRLGLWVLDTFPDSYGHAGFVYVPTVLGGVVAVGGDADLCVGAFVSDDALCDGDALWFWESDDDDDAFRWACSAVRHLVRGGRVVARPGRAGGGFVFVGA